MWYCAGCKYYNACGDSERKVGCKGRDIHPDFKKYVDTMVDAYTDNDFKTLDELKAQNIDWYNEVMESMSCLL